MSEPGTVQTPLQQHVVVVGADTTTVRLVEELARSGELLVVIAHGESPRGVIADIEALGCLVITATHVREAELRAAGVERARAAIVLGDDDVMALRVGLMIDELAPGLRIVIEMTNPRLGDRLISLIGDCTLLSSAELAAPAFVAAALATPDTQSFEIGGRSVAAGPRDRIGGEVLAIIGDTRRTGIDDLSALPLGFQFGALVIQLFGLVLSAGITAVIVDALIGARLAGIPAAYAVSRGTTWWSAAWAGSVPPSLSGSSPAAYRWSRSSSRGCVGVLQARQLKIPVIVAPASDASGSEIAGIGRADAVLAVTDDEAVNLEIALVAKDANPAVRVVARVFDHDLARRVERRLQLGATRSVSMLAAPAFAAAALGRRREVIFPIGRRVLLFTESR